jgi:hypothetical protein
MVTLVGIGVKRFRKTPAQSQKSFIKPLIPILTVYERGFEFSILTDFTDVFIKLLAAFEALFIWVLAAFRNSFINALAAFS